MADEENPWLADPWREPPKTADERRLAAEAQHITDERRLVADADELLTDLAVLDDDRAISDAMHWMQHGHGMPGHPLDQRDEPDHG